jgi:hypothetical protein
MNDKFRFGLWIISAMLLGSFLYNLWVVWQQSSPAS